MLALFILSISLCLPGLHGDTTPLRIQINVRPETSSNVPLSCNILSITILSSREVLILKEMSATMILTNKLNSDNKTCHYQTLVPNSERIVALSAADDLLNGYISYNNQIYLFTNTSLSMALNFVDLVIHSESSAAQGTGGVCGVVTKSPQFSGETFVKPAPSTLNFINSTILDFYIELYVIADNAFYTKHGSNSENYIAQIINNVDALYRLQGIHILLVGVEIWAAANKMTIYSNAQTTLSNLLNYRASLTIHHDVLHLLSGYTFSSGVLGIAYTGAMCNYPYSSGLSSDSISTSAYQTSVTVSHEIGHNLGLSHDNLTACRCGTDLSCIMNVSLSSSALPSKWSDCSLNTLSQSKTILQAMRCLQDLPDLTAIRNINLCGNGVVDEGEDCDPGLLNTNSTCCDPSTCKFRSGARCSSGRCCNKDTCQFNTVGTSCRPSSNECDLPEYCDGMSEHCPDDRYKINTTPCDSTQGFCYNGYCSSRNLQCQLVMGATGSSSSQCYSSRNTERSSGYCSYRSAYPFIYPSLCNSLNYMCGQLHCNGYKKTRETWFTINNSTINGEMCFYGMFDLTFTGFRDPLLTPNGASCGTNSWCIDSVCQSISPLPSTCSCGSRGVCNDLGNCHCDNGYYGDDCSLSGGCGGSIDSGPPCSNRPRLSSCPASYCKNGGTCVLNNDGLQCFSGAPYCCQCPANYLEPRCDTEAQKATQVTITSKQDFQSDYENSSSPAFKDFDKAVSRLMRWSFRRTFGVSQISVRVLQIRRGSTIGEVAVKGGADLATSYSSIINSITQFCSTNDTTSQSICSNSLIQSPLAAVPTTIIDSCSAGNDCSVNAVCTPINNVNYTCSCKSGYTDAPLSKSGRTCVVRSVSSSFSFSLPLLVATAYLQYFLTTYYL